MKKKFTPYSEEELIYLKHALVSCTPNELALLLTRSRAGIADKISRLTKPETKRKARRKAKEKERTKEKIRLGKDFNRRVWTALEEKQIMTSVRSDADLAILMSRTINSIQKKRHRLIKDGYYEKNKIKPKSNSGINPLSMAAQTVAAGETELPNKPL